MQTLGALNEIPAKTNGIFKRGEISKFIHLTSLCFKCKKYNYYKNFEKSTV